MGLGWGTGQGLGWRTARKGRDIGGRSRKKEMSESWDSMERQSQGLGTFAPGEVARLDGR